jgi:phenylacetate-coenzyme A ligase PaaK-like adenylate-forming protein
MITKNELSKLGLLPLEDFKKAGVAKDYFYRMTSGTTEGFPLIVLREKVLKGKHEIKWGFYSGIRKAACFYGSHSMRLSHLNLTIMRNDNISSAAIFLDYSNINSDIDKLLTQFEPDSLCGFPSFVIRALEHINNPKLIQGIQTVRLIGESLSPQKLKIIQTKLPSASISLFYGVAEIGIISVFCKYLPLGYYHSVEGIKIELIDCDEDGIGQIIISASLSSSVRVKKYKVGDLGRFIRLKKPCPCGREVTFEVLGRKNFDFIKLCGAVLTQKEFERVAGELKSLIIDFAGKARETMVSGERLKGEIFLEIIPTALLLKKGKKQKFLADEFSRRLFLTPTQTLSDLVKKDIFLPLRIVFKNELKKKTKDIKLERI